MLSYFWLRNSKNVVKPLYCKLNTAPNLHFLTRQRIGHLTESSFERFFSIARPLWIFISWLLRILLFVGLINLPGSNMMYKQGG